MAKFTNDEPVLAVTGAFAVVNYVLSFLVTHGIITHIQASSTTQALVPIVAAGLTTIAGIVIRSLVTPVKKAESWLDEKLGPQLSDIKSIIETVDPNVGSQVDNMVHLAATKAEESVSEALHIPEQDVDSVVAKITPQSLESLYQ